MKWWAVFLMYFVICVYSLLDSYHTSNFMSFGVEEANPYLSFFMERVDPLLVLYGSKGIFLILLGILLLVVYCKKSP